MTISVREAQKLVGRPEDPKKAFIKHIKSLTAGSGLSLYDMFREFCTACRIAIMQPFYRSEELEQQYLAVVPRVGETAMRGFPPLYAYVVLGLEKDPLDFLGQVATQLEVIGGRWARDVALTPPSVAYMMAKMIVAEKPLQQQIERQGFITVQEPAAGAGVMILCAAEIAREEGYDPGKTMWVEAWEIREMLASMCYIQMALSPVAGVVVWGDSLKREAFQQWFTPMYFIEGWGPRLQTRRIIDQMKGLLEGPPPAENPGTPGNVFLHMRARARHEVARATKDYQGALQRNEVPREYRRWAVCFLKLMDQELDCIERTRETHEELLPVLENVFLYSRNFSSWVHALYAFSHLATAPHVMDPSRWTWGTVVLNAGGPWPCPTAC